MIQKVSVKKITRLDINFTASMSFSKPGISPVLHLELYGDGQKLSFYEN